MSANSPRPAKDSERVTAPSADASLTASSMRKRPSATHAAATLGSRVPSTPHATASVDPAGMTPRRSGGSGGGALSSTAFWSAACFLLASMASA